MSASNSKQAQARELKHRVLTCLHKLSDRDTHAAAASELESIARNLPSDALPSFLSSISAVDSTDKSPVRRQCLHLVSVLSENHGDSLVPHLAKLLSTVVRQLRDPNSSVRSACVAASLSLSSHLTNSPFTSIAKPLIDCLFIEQDMNTQKGAALCLAAIIEGSRNVDTGSLRRLIPRLQKLSKCDSFKAKSALLAVIGSVVGVNGVFSTGDKYVVSNLITCLMEFLNSDDWAARKAASEALMKMAVVVKDALPSHKSSCLKAFESKRFDKVKAAREAMNLMIEVWKEIPDVSDEFKEIARNDCDSPAAPQVGKRALPHSPTGKTPASYSTPSSTAKKRVSFVGNESKSRPPIFRKLDRKTLLFKGNVKAAVPPGASSGVLVLEGNQLDKSDELSQVKEEGKQFGKPEVKRALFDDAGDVSRNQGECNDLSLIRKQLVQIERQQSHLLDLLQKLMGTSQSGMHSLEARVHGLELALDEISFDIATSTRRTSRNHAAATICCKLPGTEFWTSKMWRKTGHSSTCQLPGSHVVPSAAVTHRIVRNREARGLEDPRIQGGRGLIRNPLAKLYKTSQEISEVSPNRVVDGVAI